MVKNNKRQRDIKSKLVAAIAMLLVSSIMMVSSTYAWFTLSTAPEVTGITTSVGANGNLEMALLPTDGSIDTINANSGVGNSTAAITLRNTTWGNLVDVSENIYYGLEELMLYPSALNLDENDPTKISSAAFLAHPSYGADGRIAELLSDTSTGVYDSAKTSFYPDPEGDIQYGVRAVGTASGMTERQLSYRNAKANANSARALAQTKASGSLTNNGSALAGIAVKMAAGNTSYTLEDVKQLGPIISDLAADDGALAQVEKAYINYLLAFAASAKTGENDSVWSTVKAAAEAADATVDSVLSALQGAVATLAGVEIPAELLTGITAYKTSLANVSTASDKYDALIAENKDSYVWAEISEVLQYIANPDQMLINGHTVAEVKADKQPLIDDVMAGKGITVSVPTGGGVYADIADQCGNYKASVKIENVEFSGVNLNTTAIMDTKSTQSPAHLVTFGAIADAAGAPTSGATGENPMTDMFGYIIDMAFRTNAPDSNLLLQADAVDRIYDSNTTGAQLEGSDETTMGHGASMTFMSTTPTFSNDQVKNLMGAIRIVFFDPDTFEIIATAKLDTANATLGADGWTAKMYIYEMSAGGTTYEVATDTSDTSVTYYKQVTDADSNVTYEAVADTTDGSITYYVQKVTAAGETRVENNVIMALTQNEAVKLSCLVYLDGTSVANKDVAATGASSMTGSMNLQFSSSAELVPMEYTPLMTNQGDATTEAAAETTVAP